jgi:hypothetical protein
MVLFEDEYQESDHRIWIFRLRVLKSAVGNVCVLVSVSWLDALTDRFSIQILESSQKQIFINKTNFCFTNVTICFGCLRYHQSHRVVSDIYPLSTELNEMFALRWVYLYFKFKIKLDWQIRFFSFFSLYKYWLVQMTVTKWKYILFTWQAYMNDNDDKNNNRFTTKDSYTWNITHNTACTAAWNLKPERFKRRSTREKRPVTRNEENDNTIIIIIICYLLTQQSSDQSQRQNQRKIRAKPCQKVSTICVIKIQNHSKEGNKKQNFLVK